MTIATDSVAEGPRGSNLAAEPEMLDFFRSALSFPSVSGNEGEFVRFVADWGRRQGFEVDLWQADEAEIDGEGSRFPRHLPLAGRPTLVLKLPGDPARPSIMFNAHSDVVAAEVAAWTHDPWSATVVDGRVNGRGACDVKGPLVSALWAMLCLAQTPVPRGDVLLELVPGEEDCVGLGTMTSVRRGWHADALIVLEPTEQRPRCASRGGCRFEIEILGRSVHGTVKWLGRDAIADACAANSVLSGLERDLQHEIGDELFAEYPLQRPITVDTIHGGQWQGMVCDRCLLAGYFELLPADDLGAWQERFTSEVAGRLSRHGILPEQLRIRFVEQYHGHRLESNHDLCRCAAAAVAENSSHEPFAWAGFNSGCEAGLRANHCQTPTLVWGPGSLAQAHAVDEFVDWAAVRQVAEMFTHFIARWAGR
jgi:acetylornithine deacetylase